MTEYVSTADFSKKIEKMLRNLALAAASLWLAVAGIMSSSTANAISMESPRDCDANAVINCGALSTAELQRKYNSQADVRVIFSDFGISATDMQQIDSTAVQGKVTKGGRVVVNGETVARNVTTAGRQWVGSESQLVRSSGDVAYYKRPPSASFESSSLKAFVVMKNGQFDFAIIASCGNPVTATPVRPAAQQPEQPAPTTPAAPTPQTPVTPASSASSASSSTAVATANVNVTETEKEVVREKEVVTVPAPTPVQTAPVVVPVQTTPTALPKTGIDDALALVALSAAGASVAHLLYSRRQYKKFV